MMAGYGLSAASYSAAGHPVTCGSAQRGTAFVLAVFCVLLLGVGARGIAQGDEESQAFERRLQAANDLRLRENLPLFFDEVITPGQRKEIQDIQRRYAAEIRKLQQRIRDLEGEREQAVEAVLTADQLFQVEDTMRQLAEHSRRKRGQRALMSPAAEQFLRRVAEEEAKGERLQPVPKSRNAKQDNREG